VTPIQRRRSLSLVFVAYVAAFVCAGLMLGPGRHLLGGTFALWMTDPLWAALAADLVGTGVIFVVSVGLRNASVYDPYWSFVPLVVVLYWIFHDAAVANPVRAWLTFGVIAFWGLRLTWNWVSTWPGLHHQDWRYGRLREQSGVLYPLVNFSGIHLFPTLIVFVGLLGAYQATAMGAAPVGWLDALGLVIGIGATLIEWVSDVQLRRFRLSEGSEGRVMDQGLWAWSRHPNYFGEISLWVSVWILGLAANPERWWFGVAGPVSMILLFVIVSIPMMEKRQLERKPSYADYQKRTASLVPWPPRKKER